METYRRRCNVTEPPLARDSYYPNDYTSMNFSTRRNVGWDVHGRVSNFNNRLLDDEVPYSLREYMVAYQNMFYPGDDYMKLNSFVNTHSGDDFTMDERSLPGTIHSVTSKLQRYGFIEGIDYMYNRNVMIKKNWLSRSKPVRMFTPVAFKKLLLISGDYRFINYYVFLDQVIDAYSLYQILYARSEARRKEHQVAIMQEKLLAKELEITKLKKTESDEWSYES